MGQRLMECGHIQSMRVAILQQNHQTLVTMQPGQEIGFKKDFFCSRGNLKNLVLKWIFLRLSNSADVYTHRSRLKDDIFCPHNTQNLWYFLLFNQINWYILYIIYKTCPFNLGIFWIFFRRAPSSFYPCPCPFLCHLLACKDIAIS